MPEPRLLMLGHQWTGSWSEGCLVHRVSDVIKFPRKKVIQRLANGASVCDTFFVLEYRAMVARPPDLRSRMLLTCQQHLVKPHLGHQVKRVDVDCTVVQHAIPNFIFNTTEIPRVPWRILQRRINGFLAPTKQLE